MTGSEYDKFVWGTEWNIIIICGWWSFPFLGHTYMGTCSDGTWTIRHQSTVTDKTWARLSSSQLDFIASGSGGFFLIMIIPLLKSHVSKPKCIAVFLPFITRTISKRWSLQEKKINQWARICCPMLIHVIFDKDKMIRLKDPVLYPH